MREMLSPLVVSAAIYFDFGLIHGTEAGAINTTGKTDDMRKGLRRGQSLLYEIVKEFF